MVYRLDGGIDHILVDEAQDISVAHLRFFAALGGERSNALFFAGDLGQRIFQQPFSWKALGDDADLQEVYDTERHLLYVACTRARDHLLVTAVEPGSEFLDDMAV